ncbi:MAG: autotransporter outer membrane beta-barrel domain-containing protein [Fusobacterium necrophorum]|nr:autotransporter outer membrane beta-barrel domain-containing protein [Fusobacterium necrophorum]
MKKRFYVTALFIVIFQLLQGEGFVVFGDSLSDTGNLARFTYNSGKIYNEHLANYFGESFPIPDGGSSTLFGGAFGIKPPSLKGPNYAQGGATANTELGMGRTFFSGGFIKFQTEKQIQNFLATKPKKEDLNTLKVVYWIGGNDMRLASEILNKHKVTENPIINKSIQDIGKQVEKLADNGVSFMVIPNVPDIAYTPKFFRQFAENTTLNGKTLFREKKWYRPSGISEESFNQLLDEPNLSTNIKHEEIIKAAIKKLLEMQKGDSSDDNVKKWFQKYQEERDKLSSLGKHFNEGVGKELEKVKKKHSNLVILRPDISSMILEVVAHPEHYGFTNATGTASKTFSGAVANIFHWGAGSGRDRIAAFDPEDGKGGVGGLDKKHLWNKGYHYVFGDEFHPSPEAHRIISDYMISMLESEDGKVQDESVANIDARSSDQAPLAKVNSSSIVEGYEKIDKKYIRGYVPYGALQVKNGGRFHWKGLYLENDGIALSVDGAGSSMLVENFHIENTARINAVAQIENGGNLLLKNGSLQTKRGSKITYPFGIRVNGKDSKVELVNSSLEIQGTQVAGISVGNQGKAEIVSSQILAKGKNAKGLHTWNATVLFNNSEVVSEGVGAWIFSNDIKNNKTNFEMKENSRIYGKEYAMKISPNVTGNKVLADISFQKSKVDGGIFTDAKSESHINMKDSYWKMSKDSSVTKLNLEDSILHFSPENTEEFHELTIRQNYYGKNALLKMKGKLSDDNSPTDKLIILGRAGGNTWIDYRNQGGIGAKTHYGIKIIDLFQKEEKNIFQLLKPVYVGNYEYTLLEGGNDAPDKEDYYLTSTLVSQDGNLYIPLKNRTLALAMPQSLNTLALSPTAFMASRTFALAPRREEAKTIRLYRPKTVMRAFLPYLNVENNYQNIFHIQDRNRLYFSQETSTKNWNDEEIKAKTKSNITKLSYPLYKNFGTFFTYDENTTQVENKTREYFQKATDIGNIKQRNIHVGLYYQHRLFDFLHLDHTLQYAWIRNTFHTEEEKEKVYGHGIAFSSEITAPVPLGANFAFIPHYQIDYFRQKIEDFHDYGIRNYAGGKIAWNKNRFSLETGIDYQWDLRRISGMTIGEDYFSHHDKKNHFIYQVSMEYEVFPNLKVNGKMKRREREERFYEIGVSYKF